MELGQNLEKSRPVGSSVTYMLDGESWPLDHADREKTAKMFGYKDNPLVLGTLIWP